MMNPTQNEKTHDQKLIEELNQRLVQQEQEFAYKQALMLTLANSAYNALIVINEAHEIIAINNSAETLFGRQKPLGESLINLTGSPELEMMVNDALINREEVFEEQVTIDKRVYRACIQVIPRDGNLFIGVALEDISDLVRLNRARRDMVANISHELRTPIANIRLIIDGLFHEHEKPKRKQSISSLRAIARETDSLLWMAEELLDLSMIESGQAIMRMIEVPASEMVDEAIERVHDQSDAKELEVINDIPSDMMVLCDRDKARRVLINLIHNAVKWSPPGETIAIHAENGDEEITFRVIDNGPGVPDEHVERIFERFYQVDASRSTSEGTGLGLAICKHIIEAHGGKIWAEGNSKRKGGRFYFTLPKAE
jgi:two-component system, OmpR family, phosphate regulon sensor histidine kinase PhoR